MNYWIALFISIGVVIFIFLLAISFAAISEKVHKLYADPYVKNRKGVFEYILCGEEDTKLLNVRVFDEATKYVYATSGVIDKNTRYDNRYGTVEQINDSLKNATSAAAQAGVSPIRLKHVIDFPAERVEKFYNAFAMHYGVINVYLSFL